MNTWFLDLSESRRFTSWPARGTIHRGTLRLRNCIEVATLPSWLGLLGQLDLSGCVRLAEVPDGVRVSSSGSMSVEPESRHYPAAWFGSPSPWRGVPVDERIVFHPETLSAREILDERNAERRRVMIERMGYLRFAEDAKAKVLNTDQDPGGQRQLLRIELEGDEPLVGLACFCPSTGRQYFLRVPPTTKTCRQAAAWIQDLTIPSCTSPYWKHDQEHQDMERRELVLMDAKSSKFWNIELKGARHTVTYGRTGTNGQSQTKEFPSQDEAKADFQNSSPPS